MLCQTWPGSGEKLLRFVKKSLFANGFLDMDRAPCYNISEMTKRSNGGGRSDKAFTEQEADISKGAFINFILRGIKAKRCQVPC